MVLVVRMQTGDRFLVCSRISIARVQTKCKWREMERGACGAKCGVLGRADHPGVWFQFCLQCVTSPQSFARSCRFSALALSVNMGLTSAYSLGSR